VTVKQARLHGIVSPTGQPDGFFIPIFKDPERSNHLLVQVVNGKNNIESFEPFFSSVDIEAVDSNLVKKIGDSAFWYFRLKDEPLQGSIERIRSQIYLRRPQLEKSPYVFLQVVTACNLDGEDAAVRAVYESLLHDTGHASASAWLDTNVLSPKIRNLFNLRSSNSRRRRLASQVLAITNDGVTTVLAPEELRSEIGDADWRKIVDQLTSLFKAFNLTFSEFAFMRGTQLLPAKQSNVPLLKRDAAYTFAKNRGVVLRQLTKSYFEDASGALRVVCTFSSRYEGKGKRKYWFGFHEIWNRWLEGSKDGFLLLGCMDSRTCFALPLGYVREHLPNLRSTGTGKNQYWHIDLVDVGGGKNLLDVPRLRQAIPLSKFLFKF
jgi:hypothetical protein